MPVIAFIAAGLLAYHYNQGWWCLVWAILACALTPYFNITWKKI